MRVLVTGATGLIGAHLVQALVDRGNDVCGLERTTGRRGSLGRLPVTWIAADLLRPGDSLDAACADCDLVFHCAAIFSYDAARAGDVQTVATSGTEALLHACKRQEVRTVVVTSSSVVFGHSDGTVPIRESPEL